MENNRSDELYHYGRKGMKWYQNIFTSGKNARADRKRKKSLEKAREVKKQKAEAAKQKAVEAESTAAKRERLLNSTNAQELYENRHLLTTVEINERINRIDTEAKLAGVAARTKTTGRDRVNKIMEYAKMANDIYDVTQKPVVKALKKKIMGEKEVKNISKIEEVLKNLDNSSDEEVQKALNRAKNINSLRDALDPDRKKNNSNGKNSGVSQEVIDDILREIEELKNK